MVNKEYERQNHLKTLFERNGLPLLEDTFGLEPYIGRVKVIRVVFDGFTPKGLCKFFIEGETNELAFHLVAPGRLGSLPDLFQKGEIYSLPFVIGVRQVGESGYVISLRLPPIG